MRAAGGVLALAFAGAVACSGEATPSPGEAASPSAAEVAPWPEPADRSRLALLVGVQDYAPGTDPRFAALEGPRNDVGLMRGLLLERFGFDERSILTLVDGQATLQGIVAGFSDWLVRYARPESEVLFYFSGHGSQVPDRSGREESGFDSSYVAFDSRTRGRDGAFDLSDDAMHALLQSLARITGRITVITDACHSGGSMRGQVRGVRAGPAGREATGGASYAGFWPDSIRVADDGDPARADIADRYVHIAACSNRQYAREWQPRGDEDGATFGAMTYFLARALGEAAPGATHRTIAERTQELVGSHVPGQSVWFEGTLDREFLGGRFAPPPDGFRAELLSDGRVRVEAGSLVGFEEGGTLMILDAGSEVRATAEIERVRRTRCWAVPDATLGGIASLRAVALSRPARVPPLRVGAEPELRSLLAGSAWAVPVESGSAEYELMRTEGGAAPILRTAEGLEIWSAGEGNAASQLDAFLRSESRFRGLWSLCADGHGELEVEARFDRPTAEELAGPTSGWDREMVDAGVTRHSAARGAPVAAEFTVTVPAIEAQRARGELAILDVRNLGGSAVHLAVLCLGENREVNVLWPPSRADDQVTAAGARERVPVWLMSDAGWTLGRAMRERYLVLATDRPLDLEPLLQASALRSSALALPPALERALGMGRTRSGGVASPESWGVASVDLLVEKPPTQGEAPAAVHR